jgi:putative transcriptional regulator
VCAGSIGRQTPRDAARTLPPRFFRRTANYMTSVRGQMLIAAGGLFDSNFRQAVVLIGAHDERGAVGVILNRPLDVTVHDAIPALAPLVRAGEALHEGGPIDIDEAVVLVETDGGVLPDVQVFDAVGFVTGDVQPEVAAAVRRARVFLGHAGWGPDQLEAELAAGAWIVEPPRAEDVFTADPRTLWRRLLERKGPPFAATARIPFDPRVN